MTVPSGFNSPVEPGTSITLTDTEWQAIISLIREKLGMETAAVSWKTVDWPLILTILEAKVEYDLPT